MSENDSIDVILPPAAARRSFSLALHGGRDQVANMVRDGGWAAFEPPLPEYVSRIVQTKSGMFIDVGANTGYYTLLAASVAPRLKVLALEPDPAVLAILKRNVTRNGLNRRVKILSYALSSDSGVANLYVPSQEHGLIETSSSLESGFKQHHSETISVPMITLDRLLRRPSTILRRVAAIKIDVEGHEASVLKGAVATIKRHRPVIFIEILPAADTAYMANLLASLDYTDLKLHPSDGAIPSSEPAHDPIAWNHAFVPAEGVDEFLTPHRTAR